ncbi:MAG: hypothetical protein EOM76_07260 [Sphingobacteriia bacterium]|nr:hypothetical protein [Sphingobacteriia bacterium]
MIISICIVITGIILTSALGLWATQSTKVPQKFQEEKLSEQYNPADIRGSYTFSEISNLFHIPLEDLAAAFMVEKSKAAEFKCKELEGTFTQAAGEIGTDSMRMFVAFYLGLPYDLASDTYLTQVGAQILKEKSNITSEQLSYLENHTITIS